MNFMLKDENAMYYECGYSCDNAIYLSLGSEAFFITDSRYTTDATQNVRSARVVINGDLYGEAVKILKKTKVKKVIFDPDTLTFSDRALDQFINEPVREGWKYGENLI